MPEEGPAHPGLQLAPLVACVHGSTGSGSGIPLPLVVKDRVWGSGEPVYAVRPCSDLRVLSPPGAVS